MESKVPPESNSPGEHPAAPESLDHIELPLITTMQSWFRLHRPHRQALHNGRTGRSRFDAPTGEYGVLYAAADPFGSFAETVEIQRDLNTIPASVLAERVLTRIDAGRPLRLIDLTGSGLSRIGADARLTTGSHAIAQQWSRAMWAHAAAPDGITYRCRHDPARLSVALFDRTERSVQAVKLGSLSDSQLIDVLAAIMQEYHVSVIDDLHPM